MLKSFNENETEIIGDQKFDGHSIVTDDSWRRIEWLTTNYLQKIAIDESGWQTLYFDTANGKYWERTFTQGEMQGGGPPLLRQISENEAKSKYKL